MFAFVIWTLCVLIFLGIGIFDWRAQKPVGFYSGIKPPQVSDVKKYNHAVAVLWIVSAVLMELMALPFLFGRQKSLVFLVPVLGTVAIVLAMPVVYNRILKKYAL